MNKLIYKIFGFLMLIPIILMATEFSTHGGIGDILLILLYMLPFLLLSINYLYFGFSKKKPNKLSDWSLKLLIAIIIILIVLVSLLFVNSKGDEVGLGLLFVMIIGVILVGISAILAIIALFKKK